MAQAQERLPHKTHAAVTAPTSALRRYQAVIVGERGLLRLLYYDFCMWLSWVPGALGLALRGIFWPRLFGSCGRGAQFGGNITLMHPHRIHIGERAVIGNGCILDAREAASATAVTIGADAILSHGVMISAKDTTITIGHRVGFGPYTVLQAAQDPIRVGDDVVVAAHCYIAAGGDYHRERLDLPVARQGPRRTGETLLRDGVWLGAHVTILGGVHIGEHSIIGAGSVVTTSLPAAAICVGAPARVVRSRHPGSPSEQP